MVGSWRRLFFSTWVLATITAAVLGNFLDVYAQQGSDPCTVNLNTCAALPLTSAQQPFVVNQCYQVKSNSQSYVYNYVNVVAGGTLVFVDDGGTIDFRVNSLLVEQGGCVKAGSWNTPFGSNGGKLTIGLWGSDPTSQGTNQAPTTRGIYCVGASGTADGQCYDSALTQTSHYCTAGGTDPCSSTTANARGNNALFEGYGEPLNFDGTTSSKPNIFGYKVFGVSYGGSVELYGKKGTTQEDPSQPAQNCPTPTNQYDVTAWAGLSGSSWARLQPTGTTLTTLTLDRTVDWGAGDQLIVTTNDWYPSHSEMVTIAPGGNPGSGTITLAGSGLSYQHNGPLFDVATQLGEPKKLSQTGNQNTNVDLRAAVGLLSRSIVVYSLGSTSSTLFPSASSCTTNNANCYFGGHVIARQGFATFQVQGVEFRQLGQGGRMGHYPVHFHLAKSTAYTNAFIKDSSVWDSNTRFIVVHGTHEVTLARNVGYLSVGHGYYLEDGSEINNLLCQNLGVTARGSFSEYFTAQTSGPTRRYIPPILDQVQGLSPNKGGDALTPVMFWAMNQYNEFVGNTAASVQGYGSCFWLLSSALSGPSQNLHWTTGSNTAEDYAKFNTATQAPLLRFRDNSCSTSMYGLITDGSVFPTDVPSGLTPVPNPYLSLPASVVSANYARPLFSNTLYTPLRFGTNPNCQQSIDVDGGSWQPNVDSCVTTVIDRFTTSFNWAEVGFGSIWLRPLWYLVLNSAVTDQLFGGLGFVGGGNWDQVPPAFFDLSQDGVFIGFSQSQGSGNQYASALGPQLNLASTCQAEVCVMAKDGIGIPKTGDFNPKRLMTIYDGPFYADGNIFLNIEPFTCNPSVANNCGIYQLTNQPGSTTTAMNVQNAAIGWKQANGFYYPPNFAFRRSAFESTSQRHYVIDQFADYVKGAAGGAPVVEQPLFPNETGPGVTPIDFSTILNDLDGTLTGVKVATSDCSTTVRHRTSSVSVNHFFDAPAQMSECASFGVQTSAYDFVTTVAAKLQPSGLSSPQPQWVVDWTTWTNNNALPFPAVPIYRQLLLNGETAADCTSVCNGTAWGCERASFLAGSQNGEAPYLSTNNGVYYLDTNTQDLSCITEGPNNTTKVTGWHTPGFAAGQTYMIWDLFAAPDTTMTYQIYVGSNFNPATNGQWVRVQPHEHHGANGNNLVVEPCTNCGGLPAVTLANGVLTLTFDHSAIAGDFAFSSHPDDEKCLPRDLCQIDPANNNQCTIQSQSQFYNGIATDFTDLSGTVTDVCQFWATATSGVATNPDTSEEVSLADCPANGCLGYAFALPVGFTPQSYQTVMAANPALVAPFPSNSDWNAKFKLVDSSCRPSNPPASLCPTLSAPPPTSIAITNFMGQAENVGKNTNKAKINLYGRFTINGTLDLDAASLTLGRLLTEDNGAGELAKGTDGKSLLPLALRARSGSTIRAATFETPSGTQPKVKVLVTARDAALGLFEFSLKVESATIPQKPALCAGSPVSTTQLRTSFNFDDGFNPPVLVSSRPVWQCLKGELKTP